MEAFVESLTILGIVLSMSISAVLIAKIYRKNSALDPKITNKLRKQQEEYIAELEHGKRKLQNKLNSMQKGPELSEIGDLDGVLPDLIGQLDGILPKWASKFIKGQPDLINTVIEYAKSNPDKAKELIGRFVKIKPTTKAVSDDSLQGL
jgi:hypothetical protein